MQVLEKVEFGGRFFVQCHIEQPPKKAFLRALEQDLMNFNEWVKGEGHRAAFVAVQKDNKKMAEFVQKRGFHWCTDLGHLGLFTQNV